MTYYVSNGLRTLGRLATAGAVVLAAAAPVYAQNFIDGNYVNFKTRESCDVFRGEDKKKQIVECTTEGEKETVARTSVDGKLFMVAYLYPDGSNKSFTFASPKLYEDFKAAGLSVKRTKIEGSPEYVTEKAAFDGQTERVISEKNRVR